MRIDFRMKTISGVHIRSLIVRVVFVCLSCQNRYIGRVIYVRNLFLPLRTCVFCLFEDTAEKKNTQNNYIKRSVERVESPYRK